MKNKKIIIVAIIIILILLVIKSFISITKNFADNIGIIEELEIEEESSLEEESNKIKSNGVFTSFNIEELDTGMWKKIDEVYVNNEEMIKSNQKILKVSNEDAFGNVYSTISGKFFIQESTNRK
ncbi:MAG: hypothetical protein J6J60_02400 [Clostridia bacterium]|nr:hypothetical protein [Clostridia bacterium]